MEQWWQNPKWMTVFVHSSTLVSAWKNREMSIRIVNSAKILITGAANILNLCISMATYFFSW